MAMDKDYPVHSILFEVITVCKLVETIYVVEPKDYVEMENS